MGKEELKMNKEKIVSVLGELRKERERKFDQSVDLIINLKDIDLKKVIINLFIHLPYAVKKKKICAFLENPSNLFDRVITKAEFVKFKTKQEIKKVIAEYDFFAAQASLMTQIATTFGRYLGPAGKMPSPQLGIVAQATENSIKDLKEKIQNTTRVRAKEPSIKLSIGKLSMKDEEISENVLKVCNELLNILPNKKESIKSILLKLTMSKAYKLEV